MARKHRKDRGCLKAEVERTLITPERTDLKVTLDLTTNECVSKRILIPAIYKQGRAFGPTTIGGGKNKLIIGGKKAKGEAK